MGATVASFMPLAAIIAALLLCTIYHWPDNTQLACHWHMLGGIKTMNLGGLIQTIAFGLQNHVAQEILMK